MLRTILHISVGIPVLFGFYLLCRWLATGVSAEFGEGVFAGVMITTFLFWAVWKLDPQAFYGERDR